MKNTARYIFTAVIVLSLAIGTLAMASSSLASNGPAVLHFQAGDFVIKNLPSQALAADPAAAKLTRYYIVQFKGPVRQAWRNQLVKQGAEILEYIPDFAYKVRMTPAQASKVSKLSGIAAVDLFRSQYKMSASLVREAGQRLYFVRLERGSNLKSGLNAIKKAGGQILRADGNLAVVLANGATLEAISGIEDVASVKNFYLNETMSAASAPARNDVAAGSIIGATAANARGYDGSSQIVAIADTGIGGGTTTTAHRDIPSSRVTAIYNWPGTAGGCFSSITNDGSVDVDSGHGTHTTGSVLSAGGLSGEGKGTAPGAHLVFQSVENYVTISSLCQILYGYTNGYYLTGLPTDLKTLFQQAYTAGARVHSNSWGSAAAGDYTTDSVSVDTFIWTNRDMVITFSAGNEGIDANSDGVIDNDSIGSPATAKNAITVGASENARPDNYPCDTSLSYTTCASQGGVNSIFTWGGAWPSDYPVNPLFSDPSAGNAEQMAAFSSRGPTDDGRIKPDVVAPGSWILSTYSDMYQQGYDASPNPKNGAYQYDGYGFPYNQYYKYLSGTSMSNPLTAGGAAVIKDYYYQKIPRVSASAALVKATIINTATDMLDENEDGANDNDFPIPNNHEGWGRVNLDAATDGSLQFVDESTALATNATQTFTVSPTGGALKVTVVWSDYPSTDTATVNLVNDLDLTVSGPGGTFLGNVFSGGWSATGGSADRRNNVENVYIQSPAAGTYTVTVKGYNVPSGPQKFALVVDGGTLTAGPTPIPPTPTNTPIPPTPTNTPAPTASTGYLSPSANAAVTSGSGDNNGYETSPANAYANDSVVATDLNSGSGTSTTYTSTQKDRHLFYNYNFSIPTSAVIKGIQVRLDARVDATTGSPKIYVQFSWDGGVTWTTALATATLSKTETTYTLGGATNTWGRTWSPANFSNANFRVRVIDVASNTSRDFYLDYIAVNVTYQP